MDIEQLLRRHSEELDRRVEDNVFVRQRLRSRLKESRSSAYPLLPRFVKNSLLYAILLVLFTIINLLVMSGLGIVDKKSPEPLQQYLVNNMISIEAFEPVLPGSLHQGYSQARQEVLP